MSPHGAMSKEFHIFAKNFDSRFIVKRFGDVHGTEFLSLFEAARHARSQALSSDGYVVIHNEDRKEWNRIPFRIDSRV